MLSVEYKDIKSLLEFKAKIIIIKIIIIVVVIVMVIIITVENEDTVENENKDMVENEGESVVEEILDVEEVNNNVIESVDDARHNLNDEHRNIVERLNEVMLKGKTSNGIMFKKVDRKTLKVQTNSVNDAIKYFKSKSMTETNDLIKATSVWVPEQIGLKRL